MAIFRRLRDTVVEEVGNRLVDPVLMAFVRHHADTEDDREDLLSYLGQTGVVDWTRLAVLTKHLGTRRTLLLATIEIEAFNGGRTLVSKIDFGEHHQLWWKAGRLIQYENMPPQTIAAALPGRPLSDLIEHPYLPRDILIDTFESSDARWSASLRATHAGPSRTPMRRFA